MNFINKYIFAENKEVSSIKNCEKTQINKKNSKEVSKLMGFS